MNQVKAGKSRGSYHSSLHFLEQMLFRPQDLTKILLVFVYTMMDFHRSLPAVQRLRLLPRVPAHNRPHSSLPGLPTTALPRVVGVPMSKMWLLSPVSSL